MEGPISTGARLHRGPHERPTLRLEDLRAGVAVEQNEASTAGNSQRGSCPSVFGRPTREQEVVGSAEAWLYEVITLDVAAKSAENLHSPTTWAYLMMLAGRATLRVFR